jgi:hypothetical protein
MSGENEYVLKSIGGYGLPDADYDLKKGDGSDSDRSRLSIDLDAEGDRGRDDCIEIWPFLQRNAGDGLGKVDGVEIVDAQGEVRAMPLERRYGNEEGGAVLIEIGHGG